MNTNDAILLLESGKHEVLDELEDKFKKLPSTYLTVIEQDNNIRISDVINEFRRHDVPIPTLSTGGYDHRDIVNIKLSNGKTRLHGNFSYGTIGSATRGNLSFRFTFMFFNRAHVAYAYVMLRDGMIDKKSDVDLTGLTTTKALNTKIKQKRKQIDGTTRLLKDLIEQRERLEKILSACENG